MLAENSLRVNSEYRLFELVLRWIKNDREGRQPFVADLMSNVRLPLLSGEELVEKVIYQLCVFLCGYQNTFDWSDLNHKSEYENIECTDILLAQLKIK